MRKRYIVMVLTDTSIVQSFLSKNVTIGDAGPSIT